MKNSGNLFPGILLASGLWILAGAPGQLAAQEEPASPGTGSAEAVVRDLYDLVTFPADTIDSGVCHMAHFVDPDGNALMFHCRYAPRAPKA